MVSTDAYMRLRTLGLLTVLAAMIGLVTSSGPAGAAPCPQATLTGFGLEPRVLDTRYGTGLAAPVVLSAGCVLTLPVLGRAGVPADGVGGVALNVTVTEPSTGGFVTAWPAGGPQPSTSNLNMTANQTVANAVIVQTGAGGAVNLTVSHGVTHLVVDVTGWFPTGQFVGVTPTRLADTRKGAAQPVGPGGTLEVAVTGAAGVPNNGVGTAVLNVTVTEPSAATFLSVRPSDGATPPTSNLNVVAGQTVPNLVAVRVGAEGKVTVTNAFGATHVVVDLLGWFPDTEVTGLRPDRVLDTRTGTGGVTGPLGPGATVTVPIAGRRGVPRQGARAVILNLTGTESTSATYLTVWPTGRTRPVASTLNLVPRRTVPNLAVVDLGPDGTVSLYNAAGQTHVIADVLAWIPTDTPQPVTVAAVGDIACPADLAVTATSCQHQALSDRVLADGAVESLMSLGDHQYWAGSAAEFAAGYNPSFGRLFTRTYPTVGNHEYGTPGAAGYFGYFGWRAGPADRGYYSVDLGSTWHVVVLNSNCSKVSCATGSAQDRWLQADLAASTRPCTVALFHHPRFTSAPRGNDASVAPFWDRLAADGAELILNGHEHNYERFDPQTPAAAPSSTGPRALVVGTGGIGFYDFLTPAPNSAMRITNEFGYVRLQLQGAGYRWEFVSLNGTVLDEGTGTCTP